MSQKQVGASLSHPFLKPRLSETTSVANLIEWARGRHSLPYIVKTDGWGAKWEEDTTCLYFILVQGLCFKYVYLVAKVLCYVHEKGSISLFIRGSLLVSYTGKILVHSVKASSVPFHWYDDILEIHQSRTIFPCYWCREPQEMRERERERVYHVVSLQFGDLQQDGIGELSLPMIDIVACECMCFNIKSYQNLAWNIHRIRFNFTIFCVHSYAHSHPEQFMLFRAPSVSLCGTHIKHAENVYN